MVVQRHATRATSSMGLLIAGNIRLMQRHWPTADAQAQNAQRQPCGRWLRRSRLPSGSERLAADELAPDPSYPDRGLHHVRLHEFNLIASREYSFSLMRRVHEGATRNIFYWLARVRMPEQHRSAFSCSSFTLVIRRLALLTSNGM